MQWYEPLKKILTAAFSSGRCLRWRKRLRCPAAVRLRLKAQPGKYVAPNKQEIPFRLTALIIKSAAASTAHRSSSGRFNRFSTAFVIL
jgi:hypothetical protein